MFKIYYQKYRSTMAGMPWIKVVVLGDRRVGKTSLMNNMAKCCLLSEEDRAFESETPEKDIDKEVLFNPKIITYDDTIKLSIWEDNVARHCTSFEDSDRLNNRLGRDASAVIVCIDCCHHDPTANYNALMKKVHEYLPFNVKIYTLITQMDKIDRARTQEIVDTIPVADDELILGVTTKPSADGDEDAEVVLQAIADDFAPQKQESSNGWCTLL